MFLYPSIFIKVVFSSFVGSSRTNETQVIVVYYFFIEGGKIGKEAAASAEARREVPGFRRFTNLWEIFNDRLWRFFFFFER